MANPDSPAFQAPVVECPGGGTPDAACVEGWANAFQDGACINHRLHAANMATNLADYLAALGQCDAGDIACQTKALDAFNAANAADIAEHQGRVAALHASYIATVQMECCE